MVTGFAKNKGQQQRFLWNEVPLSLTGLILTSLLIAGCGGDGAETETNAQQSYTVSAQVDEGGALLPQSQTVAAGEMAEFEIEAAPGYLLDQVSGCGGQLEGERYLVNNVSSDCTITAKFAAAEFTIGGLVQGLAGDLSLSLDTATATGTLTLSNDDPQQVVNFTFAEPAPVNTSYEVSIKNSPTEQQCIVENGFGKVPVGGIADIEISCSTSANTASLSGIITPAASVAVDSDVNDLLAEYVDNSTFSRAQPIQNRTTVHGFASDVPTGGSNAFERFADRADRNDYFQVALQKGQLVQLQVVDFDGFQVGSTFQGDLDLFLYDASHNFISYSDTRTEFEEVEVPTSGSYFVRVTAYNGISKYVLRLAPAEPEPPLGPTNADETTTQLEFVPGEMIVELEEESGPASTSAPGGLSKMMAKTLPESRILSNSGDSHAGPALVGIDLANSSTAAAGGTSYLKTTNPAAHEKTLTLQRIKDMRLQPGVKYAEPNYIRRHMRAPNDPGYRFQWHYTAINMPQAWDISTGRQTDYQPIVAVVDTGIVTQHPDLQEQLMGGYDFIRDPERALDGDGIDPDPDDPGDQQVRGQSSWHGTHVAGTVAAATDNGVGVAGTSWATWLMPIRVLGSNGGSTYDIIQGLRYAAGLPNDSGTVPARRADVANLSLGSAYGSVAEQEAISEVIDTGMVVVAAAGNEDTSRPSYPASYDGVVSVSATDIQNSRAPYSNFGPTIDVAAPGGNMAADLNGDGYADGVLSTLIDDTSGSREATYAFYQGTSMAAPHVSGVVALMKGLHPQLTAAEFDQILASGAITQDLGAPGRDDIYGNGLINARLAVQVAQELAAGEPLPEEPPQLVALPSMINLGLAESASIEIRNQGGGDPQLASITAQAEWLTVVEQEVTAAGLGTYEVSVDRNGLPSGLYQSEVIFTSASNEELRVQVAMQVGFEEAESDLVQMYVLLVNADTREVVDTVVAEPYDGGPSFRYQFDEVDVGRYLITAGSDIDVDSVICQSGEVCGAYPTLNNRSQVEVDGTDLDDLDFVANILGAFPSTQTAPVADDRAGKGGGLPIVRTHPEP